MAGHRLKLQVAVELAQSFLWYSDIATAGPIVDAIKEFVGLELEFDGVLGRRTRYQEDAKSQLVLRMRRREDCYKFDDFEPLLRSLEARAEGVKELDSPKNVSLNDDTVLDQVQFETVPVDGEKCPYLFPEEECYLLLLICVMKRTTSSNDEISQEELGTFINYIIHKTQLFPVRFKSLFLRTSIQTNSSRRIQRSMMQLDTLVDSTKTPGGALATPDAALATPGGAPGTLHAKYFYASFFEPSWVIEKHLADTLTSMGCVKASLDIYERLGYWEDVIFCYHQ